VNRRALLVLFAILATPTIGQKVVVQGEGVEDLGHVVLVHDLDGDGKAEIICGAPRHITGTRHQQGRVLLIRGGDLDAQAIDQRSVSWRGAVSGDLFGTSIAIGDVNGDRHADLLVGAPGRNQARGAAFLLLGDKDGSSLSGNSTSADADFHFLGDHLLGALGRSVCLGDLDGDGLADVILAEPMVALKNRPQAGRVLVFKGRKRFKGKGGTVGKEVQPDLVIEGRSREGVGSRLLCSDLDGDGVKDLIMASPWHSDERGILTMIRGQRQLLKKPRTIILDRNEEDLVIRGYKNGRFGEAICAMDLDDDGRAELLASEPRRANQRTKEAGALYAFSHDPKTRHLDLGRLRKSKNIATLRGLVAFEQLGTSVFAGKFGGQSPDDLVIGSPKVGRVVVYLDPPAFDPPPRPDRAFMPTGSGLKGFGSSLAAGDVNGDGKAEIIIAAPGANKVFVYQL